VKSAVGQQPVAGGGAARADRWRHALILVVTRACDLRCAYCPTVKDGEPDLRPDDARRALALFVERFGGGDCKLFGGEPLLTPETVETVIREAPPSVNVYLSTNGKNLSPNWISLLRAYPRTTLTVSIDGEARDHDGLRRGSPTLAGLLGWLPELLSLPRFVVTQTIAPSTAVRAAQNFRYLLSLGIRRFNLLPGYYLPWRPEQLTALRQSFAEIADEVEARWGNNESLYLRNLFVSAPVPFYNTGFVVDSDRRIYPNNLVLAGNLDHLRAQATVGTLDNPPSNEALVAAAGNTSGLLHEALGPHIMDCTAAADAELTRLVNRLYPAYFAMRNRRRASPPQGQLPTTAPPTPAAGATLPE
jgi:hypothetical protein